jgi:hypothetical protein
MWGPSRRMSDGGQPLGPRPSPASCRHPQAATGRRTQATLAWPAVGSLVTSASNPLAPTRSTARSMGPAAPARWRSSSPPLSCSWRRSSSTSRHRSTRPLPRPDPWRPRRPASSWSATITRRASSSTSRSRRASRARTRLAGAGQARTRPSTTVISRKRMLTSWRRTHCHLHGVRQISQTSLTRARRT